MNGKIRKGAFPQERAEKGMSFNTALDWKGMYDPRLTTDCRCADGEVHGGLLSPWIAISSVENWGPDAITPQGFIDGETSKYKEPFVPLEEMIACDIFGNILNNLGDDHNDRFFEIEEDSLSHSSERQKDYQGKSMDGVEFLRELEMSEDMHYPDDKDIEFSLEQEVSYDDLSIYENFDLPSRMQSRDSKKEIRTVSTHGSFSHGWRGSDKYKSIRKGKC